MSDATATALRPDRPFVAGALVLVALVTLWLFVPTMFGHVAVMNADAIDVTPTAYQVSDDGDAIVASLDVHNPTRRAVTLYSGLLVPRTADGTKLSDGTTSTFEEVVTIPSGETRTMDVRISLGDGQAQRARTAASSPGAITLTGTVRGRISDEDIRVNIRAGGAN
jgi:hypothetical protein